LELVGDIVSASSIDNWDESTLRFLIQNQVQESIHLDYKRSETLENTEANKNEISKDVSSFANSDGEIIVYGVEESGHIPTLIDIG
jgi:predicted HTH transcriptional regulator